VAARAEPAEAAPAKIELAGPVLFLRDVGDGHPQWVTKKQMVAEWILLGDHGHGEVEATDESSRRFADQVRSLNRDWQPGQVPRVPQPKVLIREPASVACAKPPVGATSRPREHRAKPSRRGGSRDGPGRQGDDSDEPPPPPLAGGRRCAICGKSIDDRAPQAKTCGDAHRQALSRRQRREKEAAERAGGFTVDQLAKRHPAADVAAWLPWLQMRGIVECIAGRWRLTRAWARGLTW
jgi:predicted nucleic acid-binding Zn ribbon protein